jgi:hypothetical protein
MADVSITPANVTVHQDVSMRDGTAGATITAGQVLYLDAADNRLKLAQCDGTAAEATVEGIAAHGASAGQPIRYFTSGTLNIGGTVVVGTLYVLSDTAGGIKSVDQLSPTEYVSVLGGAITAARLKMFVQNLGVVVPGGG